MYNLELSALGHTWIIDLDGTILKHNGYKIDGEDTFLPGAKEFLENISFQDMVIFITSRKKEYKSKTESFLIKNGVKFTQIIYEAPLGERVLINDNKPGGLCTSVAVAVERDAGFSLNININNNI